MTGSARGVLFDFSGTLFDDTSVLTGPRLAARCAARGVRLPDGAAVRLCTAIQSAVSSAAGVAALRGADRDSEAHRTKWVAFAGALPGVPPEVAEAFHDCVTDVRAWRPYPDTAPTLRALRLAGVPVAVVSNTGWDIRGSFEAAGLAEFVHAFVLSCDLGVEKPDARLYDAACRALGVSCSDALMVGDDPVKDGGAASAGVPVYLLSRNRAGDRPRGLAAVLRLAGAHPEPTS